MKKEAYRKMTETTRKIVSRVPFGEALLKAPTILCGVLYICYAFQLYLDHDTRLLPFLISPAVCFLSVTVLRKAINRTRPYDAFNLPPVGKHLPRKGKSMPSRHAASAVAILMAILLMKPPFPLCMALILLALLICMLRILTGQHYPEDVLAGAVFSILLSLVLFAFIPRTTL